ncbi:MAG: hypothetical protein MJZ75_06980 [Paludibacteraceae bacterium]|nr:hypothetical protein [Paludibacteraceae bacterium]
MEATIQKDGTNKVSIKYLLCTVYVPYMYRKRQGKDTDKYLLFVIGDW